MAALILGVRVISAGGSSALSGFAESPRDLRDVLAPVIERARIPGVVAVVLRGDAIVAQGAAGVRKRGGSEPITIHDSFEIASCTKALTATLAALLIDEGRLTWDTTLDAIFAHPTVDPGWHNATLRQLLAHRSGLKDRPLQFLWSARSSRGDTTRQRRHYVDNILSRGPVAVPGARFRYGGTNYIAVAAALEQLTGGSYEMLLQERLFAPLGMDSGGLGPPGRPGLIDQPWGHGRLRLFGFVPAYGLGWKPFDPGSPNADYPRAGAPAGMIHLSVLDWAKFASLHLRGDPANPHREVRMLAPATFTALHGGSGENAGYSGGWFIDVRPWARGSRSDDRGRVLYHAGENGRWTCVAWLAPEIDLGILIACNRGGMHRPVDEIAARLVGMFAQQL